jgi:hypothetical protein
MVDNEKRKEIEEIALFEEEKKERLTNEIIEENFDILEEKKENENIIIDIQKEKPYILGMLPNLYEDEVDIKGKNKEKSEQKKEELNVIKEIKGKPSKISLNKKKGIISKKKEPIFQILLSKNVSEKEKSKNDNFCQSFFLVSFSKDCKIIEDSINNQADCYHSICNSLHAIKPEFIYIYRDEKKDQIELNSFSSSSCFPNGIKLCYEQDEIKIKTVKNFINCFTNQFGKRFFAVTYYFFIRKNNNEFEDEQNMTPIQYEISSYQAMKAELNTEKDKEIFKRLEIIGNLSKKKYVYVPYCACLKSKFPFLTKWKNALKVLSKL